MQAWSRHTVQCDSITSHDTLYHCLSSNNGLENSDRELGHLHTTAEAVNTLTTGTTQRACTSQQVHHPANCIRLVYAVHFAEMDLACETSLQVWLWMGTLLMEDSTIAQFELRR